MARTSLKLMAEYGHYTLWAEDGAINPERLALSPQTKQRLFAWASIYHDRLNWHDPAATAPWNPELLQAFEEEGRALWEQLRHELGDAYVVTYFSEKYRREFRHPEELLNVESDVHPRGGERPT